MRLFKFLVISNEVIKNSELIKPVVRVRKKCEKDRLKLPKSIVTKNEFFFLCHDLDRIQYDILTQFDILYSSSGLVLMSLDYPNAGREFMNNNKAYIIMDAKDIDEVMKLIAPIIHRNNSNFQGCSIKDCSICMELSKPCRGKGVSLDIPIKKRYIRGKTWSFANDKVGTKRVLAVNINGLIVNRVVEPKTGGIAYSSLQWELGNRPENLKRKAAYVPLHHWIKCNSIPDNKTIKNEQSSFYHIGHIFDCRKQFIGIAANKEQENIRKVKEPKNEVYRGRRVIAQHYWSKSLQCRSECSDKIKPKCRDCEGVLYIDTEEGLSDLYNQLMSNEYQQLIIDKML